jgi:hypothetical protein
MTPKLPRQLTAGPHMDAAATLARIQERRKAKAAEKVALHLARLRGAEVGSVEQSGGGDGERTGAGQ